MKVKSRQNANLKLVLNQRGFINGVQVKSRHNAKLRLALSWRGFSWKDERICIG